MQVFCSEGMHDIAASPPASYRIPEPQNLNHELGPGKEGKRNAKTSKIFVFVWRSVCFSAI